MLLGSEGRLGLLTQATVRVSRLPQEEHLSAVFFPTWTDAKAGVQALAGQGLPFAMLRLSNATETMTNLALAGHERQIALLKAYLKLRRVPPATACLCLVGFIGARRIVRAARREAIAILRRYHGVSVGRAVGNAWKKNRFRSAYLRNTLWDLGYAVDTLETAVTWDKVTATTQKIETALQQAVDDPVLAFSHLSHVYASGSSIYTTFVFRLGETPQATLQTWDQLKRAASREIVEAGGTISHQHGIGSDHLPYVEAEKGPVGLKALQQFFAHLDPGRRMNPGKCIPEIDKIT
jgi:alkyldihydroxyacetonephosphate synthase